MQVFIIASMCIINLVLWLVFFIKFKRLFTTDDEIQKTREQYELLINDINRNTLANINLIDEKINELNELIEVADKRLSAVHDEQLIETSRQEVLKNLKSSKTVSRKNSKVTNYAAQVIDQDAAYEVNVDVKKSKKKQGELFEEEPVQRKTKVNSRIHVVDTQGNAYGKVPVVTPDIYMAEQPVTPVMSKKAIHNQIVDLYNLGLSVEEISKKLNKSTTEVQFIIDML